MVIAVVVSCVSFQLSVVSFQFQATTTIRALDDPLAQ